MLSVIHSIQDDGYDMKILH